MKVFHSIYDDLIRFENIYNAWSEFRLGKTDKKSVFEFEYNLEDNLFLLKTELANLKYRHGGYERFIVNDPKRRIIHKASVRDRIVHTLVSRKLEEIYQNNFISHSFACQKDRGSHKALGVLEKMCRAQSQNYTKNFWHLKCDIKKFFDNVSHEKMIAILREKIKDKEFIWLIEEILKSFHCARAGVGLPLGNFTSQWLGNIYLNKLDYFVKYELRIKQFIRYADDFVILHDDKLVLKEILTKIQEFLSENLGLEIHKNKTTLKKFGFGINWVGYKILPHYVILKRQAGKRSVLRLKQRRKELDVEFAGLNAYNASVNSYLGQLNHCEGHKLSQKIKFENIVYDYLGKIF
ncbi:MAG: Reverse transcriptase protein [Parcubacteria group bacterium]|nr:Reverse transcriptase protein [Parcubacteria group bacterium]